RRRDPPREDRPIGGIAAAPAPRPGTSPSPPRRTTPPRRPWPCRRSAGLPPGPSPALRECRVRLCWPDSCFFIPEVVEGRHLTHGSHYNQSVRASIPATKG